MAGMCAFPYVSLDPKHQNECLLGVYVARCGEDSVICPLFKDDFMGVSQIFTMDSYIDHFDTSVTTVGPLGTEPYFAPVKGVAIPVQTNFVKSSISEFLPQETYVVAPAVLKKTNGVSPLRNAHVKYDKFPPYSRPREVKEAMEEDDFWKGFVGSEGFVWSLLSFEEALFGGEDSNHLEASSSSGFPHILGDKKKRRQFFDPSNGWYDPELKLMVETRLKLMRTGVYFNQVVTDCLKDELRPLDRVEACKTRLFNVGDLVTCIVTKMIFGKFIAYTKAHRARGSVAVGHNVHDFDWKWLHSHMFKFGRSKVFGGDIESQDFSTARWMLLCALEFFSEVFCLKEGSEDFHLVASCLYSVMSTVHVCMGVSYHTWKGNSSGNWLTTFLNCLTTWVYFKTIFFVLKKENGFEGKFLDFVSMGIYGDDNQGSTTLDWFNNISISVLFKKLFNVGFTDPEKGLIIDPWLPKSKQIFLSRKMVEDGGYVRAPLQLDSLFGMLHFVRAKDNIEAEEKLKQNISVFQMEMVHFLPEERERLSEFVRLACSRAGVSYDESRVALWHNWYLQGYVPGAIVRYESF